MLRHGGERRHSWASVTELTAGTSYTFSAYRDGACTPANRLATAAAHATLPPPPGQPTASIAGQASGAVRLGAALGGGAAPVVRWEYRRKAGNGGWDATWREIASTSKTLDHTVTGLAAGTAYRFKVRAVNASGAGAESAASDAVTPRGVSLTASAVQAETATLTLGGHGGSNWYYKRTAPSGNDNCIAAPGATVSLSTLPTGRSHTYKAYSDGACAPAAELASETFLTKPGRVTGVAATAGAASLNVAWTARADEVTGYKVQWKSGAQNWSTARETTAVTNATALTGLTNGATYTIRVAAANATGDGAWSAEATGTPSASATTLTASAVRATSATLTIANHTGDWHYKYTIPAAPEGACSTAVSTPTASLAGLDAGTSYTFKAYSDRDCTAGNELASVPFLTWPGQAMGVTAAARPGSLAVSWTAVAGASGYTVQWRSGAQRYESGGAREATVPGGAATTHTIPSLTDGTAYTIRVRAANATGPGAWSADATGAPAAATLTASAIAGATATLTIANHAGGWYYRYTVPGGDTSCTAVGGATATLSDLGAGTRYTFKAYRDAVCATELASTPLLTAPGGVTGVTVAPWHRSLAVGWTAAPGASGYKVQWRSGAQRYQSGGDREATVGAGTSWTIPALTNGAAHSVRVRAINATGEGAWSSEATGAPVAATLTASAVQAATATLTIANQPGAWYYRYTVPSGDTSCTEVGGGATTASLTGLDPGTSYTFKAYGDAGCAMELTGAATDADFLTRPARVTGLTVTPGHTLGVPLLAVSWTAASGTVTGYKVQWKSGSEEYDTSDDSPRQSTVTGAANTTATITDLTNGATYQVRVTAYNATGDGAASAEASGAPVATLTASAVQADTATLTITNHAGDWHYKYTVPATPADTCSSAVSATTADLTGLGTGTSHTFKAYGDADCTEEITGDATDAELLTKPGQVTGETVAPGATATPGAASLAVGWTAPGGTVTGYRVQWKSGDQSFDATRQRTVTGATTATATVTGLANAATFTVRVHRVQRHRRRRPLGGGERRDARRRPRAAHRSHRERGRRQGDRVLDGGERRRRDRHRLGGAVQGGRRRVRRLTAVPNGSAGTRRHTVTKLANGVVHRFKVRAVNGAGAGAASAESPAATPSSVCGRTPAVRDAIVASVSGKNTCSAVTDTDLAGVIGNVVFNNRRHLNLAGKHIGSLKPGDFAGLTSVTEVNLNGAGLSALPAGIFDPLTALTKLTLTQNDLTSLPAGVFDRTTALTTLYLNQNSLTSLPAGVFDKTTGLTELHLRWNSLTGLPAGVFDKATGLTTLYLGRNRLTSLPAGVFDKTTALQDLRLWHNQLATLRPGVFDKLGSLRTLWMDGSNPLTCLPFVPASVTSLYLPNNAAASSFAACGAGATPSESGLSVGTGGSKTYTLVLAASPNRYASSGAVTVTLASSDATKATFSPGTLVFGTGNWNTPQTVTVTGVRRGVGRHQPHRRRRGLRRRHRALRGGGGDRVEPRRERGHRHDGDADDRESQRQLVLQAHRAGRQQHLYPGERRRHHREPGEPDAGYEPHLQGVQRRRLHHRDRRRELRHPAPDGERRHGDGPRPHPSPTTRGAGTGSTPRARAPPRR